eukprot:1202233-Rhodomonas_salina.1
MPDMRADLHFAAEEMGAEGGCDEEEDGDEHEQRGDRLQASHTARSASRVQDSDVRTQRLRRSNLEGRGEDADLLLELGESAEEFDEPH